MPKNYFKYFAWLVAPLLACSHSLGAEGTREEQIYADKVRSCKTLLERNHEVFRLSVPAEIAEQIGKDRTMEIFRTLFKESNLKIEILTSTWQRFDFLSNNVYSFLVTSTTEDALALRSLIQGLVRRGAPKFVSLLINEPNSLASKNGKSEYRITFKNKWDLEAFVQFCNRTKDCRVFATFLLEDYPKERQLRAKDEIEAPPSAILEAPIGFLTDSKNLGLLINGVKGIYQLSHFISENTLRAQTLNAIAVVEPDMHYFRVFPYGDPIPVEKVPPINLDSLPNRGVKAVDEIPKEIVDGFNLRDSVHLSRSQSLGLVDLKSHLLEGAWLLENIQNGDKHTLYIHLGDKLYTSGTDTYAVIQPGWRGEPLNPALALSNIANVGMEGIILSNPKFYGALLIRYARHSNDSSMATLIFENAIHNHENHQRISSDGFAILLEKGKIREVQTRYGTFKVVAIRPSRGTDVPPEKLN